MLTEPKQPRGSHTAQSPESTQLPRKKAITPATISWITERDILREFGDRRTRAVLAILTARRSAKSLEFFVPPHIASLFRLSPKDLSWALDSFESTLLHTTSSTKGKFRKVRLLPAWEDQVGTEREQAPTGVRIAEGRGLGSEATLTPDPSIATTLQEIAVEQAGLPRPAEQLPAPQLSPASRHGRQRAARADHQCQ